MPKRTKDTLRPYQAALIPETMSALDQHGSVVLQLPTGGGKTHIATEIARRACSHCKTVWFVCHRREILKQTSDGFKAAGLDHGVAKAGAKIAEQHAVWVCSVGALSRRLEQMDPPDLIIWDEAHHIVARTWAELKDKFGHAHHLGLTATPDRLDGTGLKESFNHLICGPDTRSLIEQGHLSTYRLFGPTIPDMRGVKTKMGDYDKGAVEKEMTKPVLVGDVVDHYKRLAPGARAIAFAISVKASLAVVERFRAAGIPAEHVDAKTSPEARDAVVEALRNGAIKVLSNVEIFTEGFDLPAIDAVILLRPTKSLALYRQMIGRGLRTAPGKAATVILDHSGLVHEHGLPDDEIYWTLEGFSRPPEPTGGEGKPRLRICPECSAIHSWADECVNCGYIYGPDERTIDEVYGELINVPRRLGESLAAFSVRMGYAKGTAFSWKERGLPIYEDGSVRVPEADLWVAENAGPPNGEIQNNKKLPDGCVTRSKFANMVSYSEPTIRKFLGQGMPQGPFGSVDVEAAMDWIKSKTDLIRNDYGKQDGFETFKEFSKRIGEKPSFVQSLRNRGLPMVPGKGIPIDDAIRWLSENPKRLRKKHPSESGLESRTAFQKRIDVSLHVLNRAIKDGLQIDENNNIPVADALIWLDEHPVRRSFRKNGDDTYLTVAQFCKRFRINAGSFKRMVACGLPTLPDGRLLKMDVEGWMSRHYVINGKQRRLVA